MKGLSFATAPDVLRVSEAAGLARTGTAAIYAACRAGDLWSVSIGHSIRIPKTALMHWLGVEVGGEASVPSANLEREHAHARPQTG